VIDGVGVGVKVLVGVGLAIIEHKTVSSLSHPSSLIILTPTAADSLNISGTSKTIGGGTLLFIIATNTQSAPNTSQMYIEYGGLTPEILYMLIILIKPK
jgi:hypothetical protein